LQVEEPVANSTMIPFQNNSILKDVVDKTMCLKDLDKKSFSEEKENQKINDEI
jgi:hypothetical protein